MKFANCTFAEEICAEFVLLLGFVMFCAVEHTVDRVSTESTVGRPSRSFCADLARFANNAEAKARLKLEVQPYNFRVCSVSIGFMCVFVSSFFVTVMVFLTGCF